MLKKYWYLFLISLLVVAICVFYPILLGWFIGPSNQSRFGDSYGMLNALFSGLAFVGVVGAIILQKEELKLQREELSATRTEFSEQSRIFSVQNFETTFFKLVDQKTTERTHTVFKTQYGGHDAFRASKTEIINLGGLTDVSQAFSTFLKHDGVVFVPALSLYKQTLRFIQNQSPPNATKFYVDLYKALFTQPELALLLYFLFYLDEDVSLRRFVKEVELFSQLDKAYLIKREHGSVLLS